MSDELLMDLADCGSPEKLLAVILKHYRDWTAPVPVEEFSTAVNIVDIRELETDGFEGALLTDATKQKGVILYKAGTRKKRRRFTIAHELGHFLMPSHKGDQHCTAADLRGTDAPSAFAGAVTHAWAPHRDCTDAGHDLALGQMPEAHQSPAAIIGQLVGMGAEPSRNLGFDGLPQ